MARKKKATGCIVISLDPASSKAKAQSDKSFVPLTDFSSIDSYVKSRLAGSGCNQLYIDNYKQFITWYLKYFEIMEQQPDDYEPSDLFMNDDGIVYTTQNNVDLYFETFIAHQPIPQRATVIHKFKCFGICPSLNRKLFVHNCSIIMYQRKHRRSTDSSC
jgi:hypothetical protein